MFSETGREHSEDQWILGGQVSLYTHCFTMVRAHEHGTKSLAVLGNCPRHQGQNGASLRALLQREVFTGPLWF